MSPRVFDGWTPTEVHEHQVVDDAGATVTTGYTVVHRESEWDDAARERAAELAAYERGECPCGCGLRAEDTIGDSGRAMDVLKFTCKAEKAKAQIKRAWEQSHEGHPEGWADGVVHYVVPVEDARPEEKKQTRTKRRRGRGGAETE